MVVGREKTISKWEIEKTDVKIHGRDGKNHR